MRNLRVSESRSKVHFDYAEREQVQYRKAGLNKKAEMRSEKADFSIPFWNYFCTLSKFCYQKEQKLRKNNYLCAKIAT